MNNVMAWGSNKKKRSLAESVVNFCISTLMPRMSTLDICIQLTRDLEFHDGLCLCVNPREFVLEINSSLDDDEFIETLCHEMVHVKQHARKELVDQTLALKKWKGQEWITLYTTLEEYMAFPWEKEAYEMESILRDRYKSLKSIKKKRFNNIEKVVD